MVIIKEKKFDKQKMKDFSETKCNTKGVNFVNTKQFFPKGLVSKLKPFENIAF